MGGVSSTVEVCNCSEECIMSLSLSLVPWAQCPLVSMTYFTKWLHFLLSIARPCRVQISLLHQSTRSSVHLLLSLPLFVFAIHYAKKQLALGACCLASCICDVLCNAFKMLHGTVMFCVHHALLVLSSQFLQLTRLIIIIVDLL